MRPKRFLTFVLLCAVPLVLLSALISLYNLRSTRGWLGDELQHELAAGKLNLERLVGQRQRELSTIAQNANLIEYLENQRTTDASSAAVREKALSDSVAPLLVNRSSYASVTCLDRDQRSVFSLFRSGAEPAQIMVNSQPNTTQKSDFQNTPQDGECTVVSSTSGKDLRCLKQITSAKGQIGTLIGDVPLNALLTDAARPIESRVENDGTTLSNTVVALDKSGDIVYHTNGGLTDQAVGEAIPEFGPIAQAMTAGTAGEGLYRSRAGDDWLVAYGPVVPSNLSLAITRNYSIATRPMRRMGWFSILVALLFGLGTATILSFLSERGRRSIERVTRGVTAIAEGDLDTEIEALSRDDMRELARGVNAVTTRLREQLAREAETRQIEAFVRLSAMLTHDLKNTINGLSMYVANLEKQFDSPAFRVESMEALTDATQKLQSLVDRLSNPVTTLSGEYKKPAPTDLVPLVKEVVKRTVGPEGTKHEIELRLPDSLIALVDAERIQTVVENLVLNALEAMVDEPGKLTITGAAETPAKVVLTVGDTGAGMSDRFMEQKLFHPFATTKKKGMGLGLYTCREVLKANDGSIDVTSKPGVGTTFRVVLRSPPSDNAEA